MRQRVRSHTSVESTPAAGERGITYNEVMKMSREELREAKEADPQLAKALDNIILNKELDFSEPVYSTT